MATRIDLNCLQELLANGAQLIEVLSRAEYGEEHPPGAISLPLRGRRHRGNAGPHPPGWSSPAGTACET
jgi:rhodanese-related sulfurtransferase